MVKRMSWPTAVILSRLKNSMYQYTIDDPIEFPLQSSVEVTIAFPNCKRWLFFVTPDLLNRVGDAVNGSTAKLHLGEPHMVVVSELNLEVIDTVLRGLYQAGELERRTLALSTKAES